MGVATAPGRVKIEYPHRRAGHCGSGSLRDLLEFHGLSWGEQPMSEGMAFGLGGGLAFVYAELPEREPPLYLVGRGAGMETDCCANLGIGLDQRRTDDPTEGWELLKRALDRGRPTMIDADISHLEYLRVRLQMTMHRIVVTGYDEVEGVAFVADNDRDEIQRCSLEALARARHSEGFPMPNRHGAWLMDFPAQLPAPREAIRSAIAGAVASMRGQPAAATGAVAQPTGLDGVARFAAGFPDWPRRYGERLPAALSALSVFVVKAGTGGALFRSLQAEFLGEAARLLDDERLEAAAEAYRELAGHWVAVAAAASRPGDAAERHAAAAVEVARTPALEEAGVEAMERWLQAAG